MQRYLDVSTQIYKTYLKSVSPADIYPYSIDEMCIIDRACAVDHCINFGLFLDDLLHSGVDRIFKIGRAHV